MPNISQDCLKHSGFNAILRVLPPPQKKKNDRFLGGDFFWEDPLGSSYHPSIIVECFKVVWDLPQNFLGPPAAHERPEISSLPKNVQKSRFFGQNSAGRAGD